MNRAERRRLGIKTDMIESEFLDLMKATNISEKDNPVQYQEMRRSFFAGAFSLLLAMMKFLDPGEEPTDKDMAQMDAIDQEIRSFFGRVGTPLEQMKSRKQP